jgi:hypothetical protein
MGEALVDAIQEFHPGRLAMVLLHAKVPLYSGTLEVEGGSPDLQGRRSALGAEKLLTLVELDQGTFNDVVLGEAEPMDWE